MSCFTIDKSKKMSPESHGILAGINHTRAEENCRKWFSGLKSDNLDFASSSNWSKEKRKFEDEQIETISHFPKLNPRGTRTAVA